MKASKLWQFDSQSEKYVFVGIVALYFMLFIARLVSGNFYLVDSYEYIEVAKKIQDFTFIEHQNKFTIFAKRPLVYPLFLSLLVQFYPMVVLLVQSVVGCISFFFLFRGIKAFGGKPNKSFLMFVIFTPSIVIYSQLFMSEWLLFFFLCALFYLLSQKKFSSKNFALIQLITLFLAFTKPVFYPLIYVNILFFGYYLIKIKKFSLWLFVPIIALQSYLNFNERLSGYRYFSTIENINLINYNLYYFKSTTQSAAVADKWKQSIYTPAYEEMDARQQNDYLKNIAFEELKSNSVSYVGYHTLTAIRGVFDPGRFDLMTFFREEDGNQGFLEILSGNKPLSQLFTTPYAYVYLLLVPIGIVNMIKVFFAIKFLLCQKLDIKLYYLLTLFCLYILLTGPVNCSRYMMPLQGILIVFAVLGTQTTWQNPYKVKS